MSKPNRQRRFPGPTVKILAWLAVILWPLFALAADVRHLSVSYANGEFAVSAELALRARKERLFHVLTDYRHWHRLNRSIIESRLVSSHNDGHHFVHSLTRACVLFFCRDISQTQTVLEIDGKEMFAVTLPEAGHLRRGLVHWRFEPRPDHVRVLLDAWLAPDFWIPPLVGPWSIKAALRREVMETARNLERLALSVARTHGSVPELQAR